MKCSDNRYDVYMCLKIQISNRKNKRATDKQTNKQTDKQTNKQTDRQTNKQTNKQTYKQRDWSIELLRN